MHQREKSKERMFNLSVKVNPTEERLKQEN
jgi:hypothetical protein